MKLPWNRAWSAHPFVPEPGSQLAGEHRVVTRWVDEAIASQEKGLYYRDVELKSQPSGRLMLEAAPDEARRYVHAAVLQAAYWERLANEFRSQAKTEGERLNPHLRPGWEELRARQLRTATVISALMRRSLPFEEADLLAVLDWCVDAEMYTVPAGPVTRALHRFVMNHPLSDALRERIVRFAARLRQSHDKDAKRYGTTVEQIITGSSAGAGDAANDDEQAPAAPSPPPEPAPVGNPAVLEGLKRHLGLPVAEVVTETLAPDGFLLRADSPFHAEHRLISEMLESVVGTRSYSAPALESMRGGDRVLRMDSTEIGRLFLATAERDIAGLLARTAADTPAVWQSRYAITSLTVMLARRGPDLDRAGYFDFLLYLAMRGGPWERIAFDAASDAVVRHVEQEATKASLTEGERYVLYLLRASWISGPPLGAATEIARLTKLIGDGRIFFLVPGEV